MIGLLQRVSQANVVVQKRVIAEIARGLVVFVAVERGDTEAHATQLLGRLTGIRVFPDRDGRMNLNILEAKGSMLLVP
ncbi:MAG: D-aminoacyl-tRNA deacylase, partial [Gammaproteobacteria bacterium]